MMRVLLAHDGSADASMAVDMVRTLAWPPNSVVRVISVIEPSAPGLTAWSGTPAGPSAELDAQIGAYYESELADVVRHLSGPERTVECAVLRGRPASVIVDDARAFRADLVVVGSRGRGAVSSLVLGSVSGEVVDHAPCPVLVGRRSSVSRVVLAADDSPSAALAEAVLVRWPIFEGLPIHVVSVADVPQPLRAGIAPTMYRLVLDAHVHDLEQASGEHRRIAEDAAARLRANGRDASAELRSGDAASEVMAAAREWGADLVVLGSRGRTGLARLLLGSVVRNVLHASDASILVVRDRSDP